MRKPTKSLLSYGVRTNIHGPSLFINDIINKLGINVLLSKVPGGALLLDQITELSKKAKNKKAFEAAMKKPDLKKTVEVVRNNYPNIAIALGFPVVKGQDSD